jgi:hypothetical protein
VTLPGHIRGASTPAAASDRIPPNVDTSVAVAITGWTVPMLDVTLSVEGTSADNGMVTVDGAASVNTHTSGTVKLRGTSQTQVGKAGNLRLVAKQGAVVLARSATFSVAAIPQDVAISFGGAVTGTSRGMRVGTTFQSDSGTLGDLDQVDWSENVQPVTETGCFTGAVPQNSGYLPATGGPFADTHGTPVAILTGAGVRVANQTFKYKDKRTGDVDIPMRNSGFVITRIVMPLVPPALQIHTEKHGAATTANGIASNAGSGTASITQAV